MSGATRKEGSTESLGYGFNDLPVEEVGMLEVRTETVELLTGRLSTNNFLPLRFGEEYALVASRQT